MWAVPTLEALLDAGADVTAVVTNPDRPSGRGMKLAASPVKQTAVGRGIDVIQERARDPVLADRLSGLVPDVAVVVAYGSILPGSLLAIPAKGFVNLHFSLLPLYRGAAPVQRAIMNGDDVTGASVMVLTEGMDEGPVLATFETPIHHDDTAGTLGERLASAGALLLVDAVRAYVAGELEPVPQDHERATYAPKIETDDARIDWSLPARVVRDLVRALDPQPGAWTMLGDARVKVWRVSPVPNRRLDPGRLALDGGLLVGTGDDALRLDEVQPATKRRMSGEDLARGLHLDGTERMGA